MNQLIYRSGCGGCLRVREDPSESYVCPKSQQHGTEYQKQNQEF